MRVHLRTYILIRLLTLPYFQGRISDAHSANGSESTGETTASFISVPKRAREGREGGSARAISVLLRVRPINAVLLLVNFVSLVRGGDDGDGVARRDEEARIELSARRAR